LQVLGVAIALAITAALAGLFFALDAVLGALVLSPMCTRACAAHGGLQRVDLTQHGKAVNCICACADGAAIRSVAGETVAGLRPIFFIVLLTAGAAVVFGIAGRLKRRASPR
jgi:hypothetical protein